MTGLREPFPDCPTAVGVESASVQRSLRDETLATSTKEAEILTEGLQESGSVISHQKSTALTVAHDRARRKVSHFGASGSEQEKAVSMLSIEKSMIASRRHSKLETARGSKMSNASSDGQWHINQTQVAPVLFQDIDLNQQGPVQYSIESPPLAALSGQASIRLLPGLDLPLEIFEVQCGSVCWTLFTYLTVPAVGYHLTCAICILDLMYFDPSRWWSDPMPRLVVTAVGLELVVLLQTISMLMAAVSDSMPAHTDMYKMFMGLDVPSLTCAVMIHRLAPLIDTAAAAALFVYDPVRWWLSDSHAGTAALLGILYAMLVQLEARARYPISGPVATWARRRNQRRVHALLLWLLHMNFVLALCSTYKTYTIVTWLALFQVACQILYIGWWRAFISNSIDAIIENSDWLLAFMFLKLPAVFAAGMGFWCLGPYSEEWVAADACSAANWVVHGVSLVADILVLAFLVLLMCRLTPLGTMVVFVDARPDSSNGTKGLSAASGLNSFAQRQRSLQAQGSDKSLVVSLRQRLNFSRTTPTQAKPLAPGQAAGQVPTGLCSMVNLGSIVSDGNSVADSFVQTRNEVTQGSILFGSSINRKQMAIEKPRSRRHSTVTFVDLVTSSVSQEQLQHVDSLLDVQKHTSR